MEKKWIIAAVIAIVVIFGIYWFFIRKDNSTANYQTHMSNQQAQMAVNNLNRHNSLKNPSRITYGPDSSFGVQGSGYNPSQAPSLQQGLNYSQGPQQGQYTPEIRGGLNMDPTQQSHIKSSMPPQGFQGDNKFIEEI